MVSIPLYQFSPDALEDWESIINYTNSQFGAKQVQIYTDKLARCLAHLVKNGSKVKVLHLEELELLTLHCHRHHIFALSTIGKPLLILGIFHEKMDLMQRLKNRL